MALSRATSSSKLGRRAAQRAALLRATPANAKPLGWLFLSDVCKHCENAGCLEACPTGAIFRTEVSSVYVQGRPSGRADARL